MALHQKEEVLCVELGNRDGLSISYGNQAKKTPPVYQPKVTAFESVLAALEEAKVEEKGESKAPVDV